MRTLITGASKFLPAVAIASAIAGFAVVATVESVDLRWSFMGAAAVGAPPFALYCLTRFTLPASTDASPIRISAALILLVVLMIAFLTAALMTLLYVLTEDPEVVAGIVVIATIACVISALFGSRFAIAIIAFGWAIVISYGGLLLFGASSLSAECWNCGEFSDAAIWTLVALIYGSTACMVLGFMSFPGIVRTLRSPTR